LGSRRSVRGGTAAGDGRRWAILGVLFLARTAMGFQFQSVASTAPFLIERFGIGYAEIGTLIGLYMLPGVAIALPGGLLGRRFGDRRVCAVGLALMIVGGLLVGAAGS
jgi:MFS family permease